MIENLEKEYKLLITAQQFKRLTEILGHPQPIKQVNHYFDTADRQIQKRLGAMRIRSRNGRFLFTLKLRQSDDAVMEYELELESDSITQLTHPQIQALLNEHGIHGELQPIAVLTTWRAMVQTADAEICLDRNVYGNTVDYEIEYEYRRPHNGRKAFQELLATVGLQYESNCRSKIARALTQEDRWYSEDHNIEHP